MINNEVLFKNAAMTVILKELKDGCVFQVIVMDHCVAILNEKEARDLALRLEEECH